MLKRIRGVTDSLGGFSGTFSLTDSLRRLEESLPCGSPLGRVDGCRSRRTGEGAGISGAKDEPAPYWQSRSVPTTAGRSPGRLRRRFGSPRTGGSSLRERSPAAQEVIGLASPRRLVAGRTDGGFPSGQEDRRRRWKVGCK